MKTKIILLAILAVLLGTAAGVQAVCNDCVLQVMPVANNLCQGDSATYDLKITNVYDQAKAITLYAAGDIPLTSDIPSQVVIDPYETKTIRTTFTPTQASVGQHRITVRATGLGVEDTDDALFVINDCYTADLRIAQPTVSLCQDSVGRLDFTLTNSGQKQDTYEMSVGNIPDSLKVSFAGGSITLAPGASRTGSLTITAIGKAYGDYELQLNMRSQAKTFSQKFNVSLSNCYHASVTAQKVFTTCPDAGLVYKVSVKNNGCVADNYTLILTGTCKAKIGASSMRVDSGQTVEVPVTLDPAVGECDLTFAAASKYDSDSATTHVTIKKCYAVDLTILPNNTVNACRGQPVDFGLRVTNTGFYADTYKLALMDIPINLTKTSMSLASGESGITNFTVTGTWCITHDVPFRASATGHAFDSENGFLRFLPIGEACAALNMSPSQVPKQIDCGGEAYTFYVTNTGFTMQDVTLSVLGAGNYLVQPAKITLKPQESRPVAIYLAPNGQPQSVITIVAASAYKRAYLELNLDFSKAACMVSRPMLSLPEQPTLPIETGQLSNQTNRTNQAQASQANQTTPSGAALAGIGAPLAIAVILVVTAVILLTLVLVAGRKAGSPGKLFPEAAGKTVGGQTVGGQTVQKAGGQTVQTDAERLTAIKEAINRTTK